MLTYTYCPHCHMRTRDDWENCFNCGKPLAQVTDPVPLVHRINSPECYDPRSEEEVQVQVVQEDPS